MNSKKSLGMLALVLVIMSLLALYWEIHPNKWLRLCSAGLFLSFAFKIISFRRPLAILALTLLLLCDIALWNWEMSLARTAYYSFHILAVLSLIFLTVRELKWPKISFLEFLILSGFFLINSWILISLGDFFNGKIQNPLLELLFYSNGFLIVLLIVVAFFYSRNYPDNFSAYFFIAVMGLTISDLMLFSIYLMDFREFRYIDNIFYVFGLFFLLKAYQEYAIWKEDQLPVAAEKEEEEIQEIPKTPKVYR